MEPHAKTANRNRRRFIQSIAAGAATMGLSPLDTFSMPSSENMPNFSSEDPEGWINRIRGKHKMVFDVTQPHETFPFAWPRVFLMTNASTGVPEKDCCAVVVLRHAAIGYAFNHSMWEKYKLGEVFKADTPGSKTPATQNPFWQPAPGTFKAPGLGPIQIGINELMGSGVMFCVCNTAMTVYGNSIASSTGQQAEALIKDWKDNLIPGIQVVPSGVWALGRAQEKGCAYVFAS